MEHQPGREEFVNSQDLTPVSSLTYLKLCLCLLPYAD